MFYYLYEIRNNLNDKIYVGVHKTKKMDDGYMGSGKVIRSAIAKHGITNFTKVILETFETSEAMYVREKEVVTDEFLLREDTYNLRRGGSGGFDYINANCGSQGKRLNESMSDSKRQLGGINSNIVQKKLLLGVYSETYQSRFSDAELQSELNLRSRSAKAIAKKKETFKRIKHQQGESHSQHGTMWITNGTINTKVKKTDPLPDGWIKGRKMK